MPEAAPLSAGKRRAFTVAMLLLPLVFFLLLEGSLRVFGYGATYPLFEPVEDFPSVLAQNRDVARRYFVREQSVPNANTDYFPARKPEGTVRIIAQGGSSTAGFPFYWGAAFPRVLGNRLRLAYPDRRFEVVNTAMAAVNSYTLLDFADEILEQDPDVIVLYAGHNEYYGALGAASAESLGRNPTLVRAFLALRRFRTVQLLHNVLASLRGGPPPGERPSNTLMARMVGEQAVPYGGEVFEAGLAQFRSNLDRLLARYAEAGVPVYIGTLASNERDQRPFVTVHAADADTTAWNAAIAAGQRAVAAGDTTAATAAFTQATTLDTLAAEGFFLLGRALLAEGRDAPSAGSGQAALDAFVRAKDLDALRFRAPEVFNAVIRELATRHGAIVVESQEAMRAASENGIIGEAMMLEHLHPTLDGYAVLADAFFETVTATADLGTPRPTPPGRRARLVTPVDSLVGLIRMDKLTRVWPFRPDEVRALVRDTAATPPTLFALADDMFDGDLSWQVATERLADYYVRRGDLAGALRARQALQQAYPFLPDYHEQVGSLQMQIAQEQNRPALFADAEASFRDAISRAPQRGQSLSMLGALLLQRGDSAGAIDALERAVRAQPRNVQALYNLSGAYALAGRIPDARRTAGQLLEINPGNQSARALLESIGG